jgi:hypothetical protein
MWHECGWLLKIGLEKKKKLSASHQFGLYDWSVHPILFQVDTSGNASTDQRLPEIREHQTVSPTKNMASGIPNPGLGLTTPQTPRIDISRASSSSHHDSRDSSPENVFDQVSEKIEICIDKICRPCIHHGISRRGCVYIWMFRELCNGCRSQTISSHTNLDGREKKNNHKKIMFLSLCKRATNRINLNLSALKRITDRVIKIYSFNAKLFLTKLISIESKENEFVPHTLRRSIFQPNRAKVHSVDQFQIKKNKQS